MLDAGIYNDQINMDLVFHYTLSNLDKGLSQSVKPERLGEARQFVISGNHAEEDMSSFKLENLMIGGKSALDVVKDQ